MPEYFRILLLLALIPFMSCIEKQHPSVLIKTGAGEITVELYPEKAPLTVSNFLDLVEQGVYTDAAFYRVACLMTN